MLAIRKFSAIIRPVPTWEPNDKGDPNEEAARSVQKITGSEPVHGEDLVSSEELKRKFRQAKKRLSRDSKRPSQDGGGWLARRT